MQGGTARTGVWIIGSRGSVATTAITGAAAVTAGLATTTGLVTMRPPFTDAGLPALGDLVFGGHDLVETPLAVRAARLVDGGVLPDGLPEAVAAPARRRRERDAPRHHLPRGALRAARRRRPRRRRPRRLPRPPSPRPRRRHQPLLHRAAGRAAPRARRPRRAAGARCGRGLGILPPSSLYALAAIEQGCRVRRLHAVRRRPHPGARGARRARTACRSAAATARRARRCSRRRSRRCSPRARCASARGRARTCSAAATARRSPTPSARAVQAQLQGAQRSRRSSATRSSRPVRIDYVTDLGEWKTAWDHIPFEGFLGVRMKLQFTWEGCDSALAAPLVLDLARLASLALERGAAGVVPELGVLLQGPGGHRRARARARSTRCSREWARAGGPPREGARAAAPSRSSSAFPPCSPSPATCCSAPRRRARAATCPRAAGLAAASSCLYLAGHGAQRLRRPRGRRRRAPDAADPLRPRHARLRARPGRRPHRRRGGDRRRRRRPARAAGPRAARRVRLGLRPGCSSRRPPARPAWPPAAGSTC